MLYYMHNLPISAATNKDRAYQLFVLYRLAEN